MYSKAYSQHGPKGPKRPNSGAKLKGYKRARNLNWDSAATSILTIATMATTPAKGNQGKKLDQNSGKTVLPASLEVVACFSATVKSTLEKQNSSGIRSSPPTVASVTPTKTGRARWSKLGDEVAPSAPATATAEASIVTSSHDCHLPSLHLVALSPSLRSLRFPLQRQGLPPTAISSAATTARRHDSELNAAGRDGCGGGATASWTTVRRDASAVALSLLFFFLSSSPSLSLSPSSFFFLFSARGLDVVTFVPTFVLGPFICPKLPGSVHASLSLAFVSYGACGDVARAHIFLLEHPNPKGRYNCSSSLVTVETISQVSSKYPEFQLSTLESVLLHFSMFFWFTHEIDMHKYNLISYMFLHCSKCQVTKFIIKETPRFWICIQAKYGLDEMVDDAIRPWKEKGIK
ncbi:hypothetical protein Ahy_A02g006270 [Arachis hypogaea]|uniref:Uncharacterized protein n=1 Tax=Arachis hypogaea TaxID=3818 RepID=A0A445E985_ARAHY|nr:hypothetical protein Ahy_A02g006270 [Arachis hypogaea]